MNNVESSVVNGAKRTPRKGHSLLGFFSHILPLQIDTETGLQCSGKGLLSTATLKAQKYS